MTTNEPHAALPRQALGQQPYLTVREVAGELDCSTRTVYRLIASGKLPAVRRSQGRRQMLVPARALEAYQRRRSGQPSLISKPRDLPLEQRPGVSQAPDRCACGRPLKPCPGCGELSCPDCDAAFGPDCQQTAR